MGTTCVNKPPSVSLFISGASERKRGWVTGGQNAGAREQRQLRTGDASLATLCFYLLASCRHFAF